MPELENYLHPAKSIVYTKSVMIEEEEEEEEEEGEGEGEGEDDVKSVNNIATTAVNLLRFSLLLLPLRIFLSHSWS